jgi:conjugative transfer signal peptidase TraF
VASPAFSPTPSGPFRTIPRWRIVIRTLATIACISAVVIAGCCILATRLTINVTASMPRGLYWLRPGAPVRRHTVVSLEVPANARALADRISMPATMRLLKTVVALPGDRVCIDDHRYVVGGELLSIIASRDQAGRPLVPFPFCGTVPPGFGFVAARGESSLDSRYFGPVAITVLMPAVPLWTSF